MPFDLLLNLSIWWCHQQCSEFKFFCSPYSYHHIELLFFCKFLSFHTLRIINQSQHCCFVVHTINGAAMFSTHKHNRVLFVQPNFVLQPLKGIWNNITAVICTVVAVNRIIPSGQAFWPHIYLKAVQLIHLQVVHTKIICTETSDNQCAVYI